MLDKDQATGQAARLLEIRKAERVVLDRLRSYWRGRQPLPIVPTAVPLEVRKMAAMSRVNIIGLVVSVHAQSLAVTGYRAEGAGDDAPQWAIWQANKLDARQSGVHRAALGYGCAYTVTTPGTPTAVIRGVSPRQMTALYGTDPDWPVYALESGRILGGEWRLYDEEAVYRFRPSDPKAKTPTLEFIDANPHDMGVCPVVRFLNLIDLDDEDEVQSEVEALTPLQDQLDFTTFDLMVAQHYAAFRQRWILGWTAKSEEEKLKAAASRLWTFEDDAASMKVGEFNQTDLSGYLESRQATVHLAGMLSQTPPQDLVSEMVNLSADAIAAAEAGANRKNADRETSFGECVSGRSVVILADGTTRPIARIVSRRERVEVLSVAEDGSLVSAPVVNWHANPRAGRRMLRLTMAGYRQGVDVTEDHPVMTATGWKRADELRSGVDRVATGQPTPNDRHMAFLVGALLGDAYVDTRQGRGRVTLAQGVDQEEWLRLKIEALRHFRMNQVGEMRSGYKKGGHGGLRSQSADLLGFASLREAFYQAGRRVLPEELLEKHFDELSLATLYLDDGCLKRRSTGRPFAVLSLCSYTAAEVGWLADLLRDRFGLAPKIDVDSGNGRMYPRVRFKADDTERIMLLVGKFVPPSMRYKLTADAPPFDRSIWELGDPVTGFERVYVSPSSPTVAALPTVYDIQVEGHHNFATLGGVVHNSWEQTLGLAGGTDGIPASDGAQVRWRDTEARSLASTVDALGKLATMLGVPVEMLWERIPDWTQQDTDRAKALVASQGGIDALIKQLTAAGAPPAPPAPVPAPAA